VLPTTFHIDIPEHLNDEVKKCKDTAAVKEVGIRWGVQQSKELMQHGVPTLHYYHMGKSDPIYKIAKELFSPIDVRNRTPLSGVEHTSICLRGSMA
jgi:methylenetetrahydrofolate reductase (NADPH)